MRIFCFGCSFTRWYWPTWADILAVHMKETHNVDVYNFGHRGISNQGIAYNIMLANEKYKFTDDDKIIVLWTTADRFDNYKLDEFDSEASLYKFAGLSADGAKFINKRGYSHGDIIDSILNSALILDIINKAFNISYNGAWCGWDDIRSELPKYAQLTYFSLHNISLNEHSLMSFDRLPLDELVCKYDSHPTPTMHLEYLNKVILPFALKEKQISNKDYAHKYVLNHTQAIAKLLDNVKDVDDFFKKQDQLWSIDSDEYMNLYKSHDAFFDQITDIFLRNIFK